MTHNAVIPQFRRCLSALLLLCTLPGLAHALNAEELKHLLWRTGFGDDPALRTILAPLNRQDAVDTLLSTLQFEPTLDPPTWVDAPLLPAKAPTDLNPADKAAFLRERNKARRVRRADLQAWFLRNAAHSPSAFAERLTLFWHNVFAVELQRMPDPTYLWFQHRKIRSLAAGDYRELVRQMALDPALLVYLDNHKNHRKRPNENYARELLELHTLGEGHYSENDVRELARVLTGARADRQTGQYEFRAPWHDRGKKSVFNRVGAFLPEDAASLILAHEQAPLYPVKRLWQEFISETPVHTAVERLASRFVEQGWDIELLLRDLLLEDAFWSATMRKQLVRSPIELVLGLHRETGHTLDQPNKWLNSLAGLGQDLFNPPDVAGWPGGLDWISTTSLNRRQAVITRIADQTEASPTQRARWLSLDYQLK